MPKQPNLLYCATQAEWRKWLKENHNKENEVWFVYHKKEAGKPSVDYEVSVEEALCYGWVDSIIKKIDDKKYVRKFTPRKDDSKWSESNKRRVEKLIAEKRMTNIGMAKIEAAKKNGMWENVITPPVISLEVPAALAKALSENKKAQAFWSGLKPTHQKEFLRWINSAKREETVERRIKESIAMLNKSEKLGLK